MKQEREESHFPFLSGLTKEPLWWVTGTQPKVGPCGWQITPRALIPWHFLPNTQASHYLSEGRELSEGTTFQRLTPSEGESDRD